MSVAGRVWLAGTASLVVAIAVALLGSSSLAGSAALSPWIRLAIAAAALALLAASWLCTAATERAALGTVLPLLAIAWVAPILVAWSDGPVAIRMAARAVDPLLVALLLHVALLEARDRMPRALRIALRAVYGVALTLGVATLLWRNAFYDVRCDVDCDVPPVLPGAPLWAAIWGGYLALGLSLVALATGLVATATRTRTGPATATAALAALVLAAAGAASSFLAPVSAPVRVPLMNAFLVALACALVVLAAASAAAAARSVRRARRVERLAEQLRAAPTQGSAEPALAELTGDASVRVGFPFGADGRLIDAEGRASEIESDQRRRLIEIRRGGDTIALVEVDSSADGIRALTDQLGSAATIAIDNERLHAEILANLLELRASRERVVAAADAVRRRTERDLHDNAQSALVGLLYSLTAISRVRPGGWTDADATLLGEVTTTVRELVTRLREVAHGVFPADLANTGLDEAIRSLVVRERVDADLSITLSRRPSARVERLVYVVVSRLIAAGEGPLALAVTGDDEKLRLVCRGRGVPPGVSDRVAALDGRLQVEGDAIVMEVPCV